LLSERVIRSADDVGAVEHCKHPDQRRVHHVVDVFLVGDAASRVPAMLEARRQLVANSSCGVCGRATIDELRREIAPLAIDWGVDVAFVRALPGRLRQTQTAFDETGGLHGAAIFSRSGRLLASAEDVGRHNAVDKCVGSLLLSPVDERGDALVVSGRVAFEIVQKAWLAGISIIVAVSAATTLAGDLARAGRDPPRGFARGESVTIATPPEVSAG